MKGKEIYEEIKKLENLREELYQALSELEDGDLRHSRAYTVVAEERDRVTKELDTALKREWDERPKPKFEDNF